MKTDSKTLNSFTGNRLDSRPVVGVLIERPHAYNFTVLCGIADALREQEVNLIAFAVSDAGRVWSIFPTTNPVDPESSGNGAMALAKGLNAWLNIESQEELPVWTDGYSWPDLASAIPNANQPTALNVGLDLTSEQAGTAAWGPGNVLVFSRLSAANASYKLLDMLGGADVIGPVLLGMAKPVHILQRGCSIQDVVNLATVAAVDWQAQSEQV